MHNKKVRQLLDKLRVYFPNTDTAEIQLTDKNNYVSIRINEDGEVDRIHIDVVGLEDSPLIIRRDN
jgi:DNA-binding protein YbaB